MLLYHRPSGTTHIVLPLMVAILEALDDGASDAESVLARIAETHDVDSSDSEGESPRDVIAARLSDLVELGLVDTRS